MSQKLTEKPYDYLIVGAGLFGAVMADRLTAAGKSCLVVEKRNHVGGNCFTNRISGIDVHEYGPHIFHTSDEKVWGYVNQFAKFNSFINCPIANYKGYLYHLPFNMNTFYELFGTVTPKEAKVKLSLEMQYFKEPKNLEEQALMLVGKTVYQKLIKEYTEKQWGKDCKELSPDIIKRLPLRFTYNNNYFNDVYQGIPIEGYTTMIDHMLSRAEVKLNCNFLKEKSKLSELAKQIIYTGEIDKFFDYQLGALEWRSLKFEHEILHTCNYQGVAVMNFTSHNEPYTRIIEHKHFNNCQSDCTVITKEYSVQWKKGDEAFYPINTEKNQRLYERYLELAKQTNVLFCGRLGTYKYLDMDKTVAEALKLSSILLGEHQ